MDQIITDKRPRPFQTVLAWIVALLTAGYMIPWAIAATRGKSNTGAIFWLNLLLGWTVVGWVIALVMSCTSHQVLGIRNPR